MKKLPFFLLTTLLSASIFAADPAPTSTPLPSPSPAVKTRVVWQVGQSRQIAQVQVKRVSDLVFEAGGPSSNLEAGMNASDSHNLQHSLAEVIAFILDNEPAMDFAGVSFTESFLLISHGRGVDGIARVPTGAIVVLKPRH